MDISSLIIGAFVASVFAVTFTHGLLRKFVPTIQTSTSKGALRSLLVLACVSAFTKLLDELNVFGSFGSSFSGALMVLTCVYGQYGLYLILKHRNK